MTLTKVVVVSASTAAVALFVYAYRYAHRFRGVFQKMGITQLPTKAFIGSWNFYMNAQDLFALELELIRKYGKVYGYFEGRTPVLMVADPDFVKQVMIKDHEHFHDRQVINTSRDKPMDLNVARLTGERWKHVRQSLTPAFTPNSLRRMDPLISKVADQLTQNVGKQADAKSDFDVKNFMNCFTMDVISSVAFAIEIDSLNDPSHPFVTFASRMFRSVSISSKFIALMLIFPGFFAKLFKLMPAGKKMAEVEDFFKNVIVNEIERRRQTEVGVQRADFLAMVLPLERDPDDAANASHRVVDEYGSVWVRNGLTRNEIIGQSLLFFIAGFETTATSMTMILLAMAEHPDVQEKLHAELKEAFSGGKPITMESVSEVKYLGMCIEETLRVYSPVLRTNRVCTGETVVNGVRIPKGISINIPVNAIHHDPDLWPEPEKFDPERFSDENRNSIPQMAYIPFGAGNRNCIGMRLALLEMKMALARLFLEFKFKVSPKTELPIRWIPTGQRTPHCKIYLQPERRSL